MTAQRYMPYCSVSECGRAHRSKGLCSGHYRRRYVEGREDWAAILKPQEKPGRWVGAHCWVATCPEPVESKGYCRTHWSRVRAGRVGESLLAPVVKRVRDRKSIRLRVSTQVFDALVGLAEARGLALTDVTREALESWLAYRKRERGSSTRAQPRIDPWMRREEETIRLGG